MIKVYSVLFDNNKMCNFYVIRKNEFANPIDVKWLNYRKSGALEDYSGPAEWANTGKGSQVVKGHKQGGILKRK